MIVKCTLALLGGCLSLAAVADGVKLKSFMQPETYRGSTVPYGDNAGAGHYVQAADAWIYYETYGAGEPLVVLHGGGVGCTYEMGQLIDSLSRSFRVIAVSTRGHGRSEIGSVPISYEQRADDVRAVLDAEVPGGAVTVLGFSDGAYAGYKLAAMYPARVRRLVAIGAGEIVQGLRRIVPSRVEEIEKLDPDFLAAQRRLMPEPERLQAYWNDFYAFYNRVKVSKELFGSIHCPVLVLAGENDPNAPLATVLAAYQMIPDSRLAIIAGAGHPAFIDNFAAVWANVRPFVLER